MCILERYPLKSLLTLNSSNFAAIARILEILNVSESDAYFGLLSTDQVFENPH